MPSPIPDQPIGDEPNPCQNQSHWIPPTLGSHVDPVIDTIEYTATPNIEYYDVVYVDTRTGQAYDVHANLQTSLISLHDSFGNLVGQRTLTTQEKQAIRDYSSRPGDPNAGPVIVFIAGIAAGIIIALVTGLIDDANNRAAEARACSLAVVQAHNSLANAASDCSRQGGQYRTVSMPSWELCGGGHGYCDMSGGR
jgi:hypothetical protein